MAEPAHPPLVDTPHGARSRSAWMWPLVVVVLLSLRLPSLVQPAGGDQGLYAYTGQRLLEGAVPYRDVWEQKPPAIGGLYALLSLVWPHESMVAGADLVAAGLVAWLLVLMGRRRYSDATGYGAACLFLLFGNPSLQRLSGIYVRGQCESFMALAITLALLCFTVPNRGRRPLLLAGAALAVAFWLKYNAIAYVLPVTVAAWQWRPRAPGPRLLGRDVGWMAVGVGGVSAVILAYFAAHGALLDLRLATVDYNLRYSEETYATPASALLYVIQLPFERVRVDMLWFLGGVGAVLLIARLRTDASARVALAWLAAAVLSIAINGQRDLPNYFVQAAPALGLVAAAGLATLVDRPAWVRAGVTVLLLAGVARVGTDAPIGGVRLGALPDLARNLRYDMAYIQGELDRARYLGRFKGQKHDVLEIDTLAQYLRETTTRDAPVFVFGFSGGSVGWKSGRVSPSRFFWSMPVILEFAANKPGYGSAGLLADLERRPPAVVILQRDQWQSEAFFLGNDGLRTWLRAGYRRERDTPMFSVWRR